MDPLKKAVVKKLKRGLDLKRSPILKGVKAVGRKAEDLVRSQLRPDLKGRDWSHILSSIFPKHNR